MSSIDRTREMKTFFGPEFRQAEPVLVCDWHAFAVVDFQLLRRSSPHLFLLLLLRILIRLLIKRDKAKRLTLFTLPAMNGRSEFSMTRMETCSADHLIYFSDASDGWPAATATNKCRTIHRKECHSSHHFNYPDLKRIWLTSRQNRLRVGRAQTSVIERDVVGDDLWADKCFINVRRHSIVGIRLTSSIDIEARSCSGFLLTFPLNAAKYDKHGRRFGWQCRDMS